MDTLPYFFSLIKSNSLIYSILISGNLNFTENTDNKLKYEYLSENLLEIYNVSFSEEDVFDKITFEYLDNDLLFSFKSKSKKYIENYAFYFGNETIYSNYKDEIVNKSILLKHPYTFKYEYLDKKIEIRLIEGVDGCKIIGSIE